MNTQDHTASATPMTTPQAAAHIGITPDALRQWRRQGKGPAFVRVSPRCVRYMRADLEKFLNDRKVGESCSESSSASPESTSASP